MSRCHLVRHGVFGSVGRFTAVDARRYDRGQAVVIRTPRGLELGEVLEPPGVTAAPADVSEAGPQDLADSSVEGMADRTLPSWGVILRPMTAADELLKTRLERFRHEAYERCAERVRELGLPVMLVDVEHLFDGADLVFYFLGEGSPALDALTGELAEQYESQVQFRKFSEAVETGCGPGCGTATAEGAGCGSCSSGGCAIASACSTRKRPAAG